MKTCACGHALVDSIDEFGDPKQPVCITCWLTPEKPNTAIDEEIAELEDEISECKSCISGLEEEIGELEDQISDARKKINVLRSGKRTVTVDIKKKLKSWINGEPIHDGTGSPVIFEH